MLNLEHLISGVSGFAALRTIEGIGRVVINAFTTKKEQKRQDDITAIEGFQALVHSLQEDVKQLREQITVLEAQNERCAAENDDLRRRVAALEASHNGKRHL